MNSPTDPTFGSVIFACRFRRLFALMFIVVGGIFTLIMLDALVFHAVLPAKRGVGFQVLFGIILLIGLFVVWVGVLQFRHPGVFFEVTERGIVNYMGKDGICADKPCFIPWNRVTSLDYVKRTVHMSGGGTGWSWFIEVGIEVDDEWPTEGFYGFEAANKAVFLDAFSGSPSGKKLLHQIETVIEQFG